MIRDRVLATLFGLLLAGTSLAQDSTGVDTLDPSTQEETPSAILQRLQERMIDSRRIEARLRSVSGEDSLVLRHRLTSLRMESLRDLHELGEFALSPQLAQGQAELRSALSVTMIDVGDWMWNALEQLKERSSSESASLGEELPARERIVQEQRLSRMTRLYDEVLQIMGKHLHLKDRLGLEIEDDRAHMRRELGERADALSGRVDLYLARREDARSLRKAVPGDADFALLETAAQRGLERTSQSFAITLNLMEAYDLSTAVHRAQLLSVSSQITPDLFNADAIMELLRSWGRTARDALISDGPAYLLQAVVFLALLTAFWFLARIVRRLLETGLKRSRTNLSQLLERMLVSAAFNTILLVGLLVALSQLGISLAPLLTGIGVAGFILGFALQDSLANFAAGLMILIYRPYDVGDLVDVGGVFGKVHKMSLVSTTILTIDNQTLVVPNNKIWGDVIKNVTAQHLRRVDMVFGIAYSDDIPHAERLLEAILSEHEAVLEKPEPMVRLHKLNESSVDFIVRPWVKTEDYWDVYWHVTREVKMRFDAEGITIPFPQRDIHHYYDGTPPQELEAEG